MAVVRAGEDVVRRSCGCDTLSIWMDEVQLGTWSLSESLCR